MHGKSDNKANEEKWLHNEEKKSLYELKNHLKIEDYAEIRERWDKEDDLLNNRSNVFLTVNAILFAATQFSDDLDKYVCLGISAFGVIFSVLWIAIARRSINLIRILALISSGVAPAFCKFIHRFRRQKCFYPTRIIAVILPAVILFFWIVFASYLVLDFFFGFIR